MRERGILLSLILGALCLQFRLLFPASPVLPLALYLRDETNTTHRHAVPNILIFTHAVNLLEDVDNDDVELEALRDNVRSIIALHPDAQVRFLTDQDCEASLRAVNLTHLIPYFRHEPQGMYKGDLCRGAALWENGGVYLDVDLGVRKNLWGVLDPATELATVRVYEGSRFAPGFFQAFWAATPRHAVTGEYLRLFAEYYEQGTAVDGLLGVTLLQQAYDAIEPEHAELWQEHYYRENDPLFTGVYPPNQGKQRACRYVVSTPSGVVPFYSRIYNSRLCNDGPW